MTPTGSAQSGRNFRERSGQNFRNPHASIGAGTVTLQHLIGSGVARAPAANRLVTRWPSAPDDDHGAQRCQGCPSAALPALDTAPPRVWHLLLPTAILLTQRACLDGAALSALPAAPDRTSHTVSCSSGMTAQRGRASSWRGGQPRCSRRLDRATTPKPGRRQRHEIHLEISPTIGQSSSALSRQLILRTTDKNHFHPACP